MKKVEVGQYYFYKKPVGSYGVWEILNINYANTIGAIVTLKHLDRGVINDSYLAKHFEKREYWAYLGKNYNINIIKILYGKT